MASFFNHSCTANAFYYYDMFLNMVIEAKRDIPKGEAVTLNYLGSSLGDGPEGVASSGVALRRRCRTLLPQKLKFECVCGK